MLTATGPMLSLVPVSLPVDSGTGDSPEDETRGCTILGFDTRKGWLRA